MELIKQAVAYITVLNKYRLFIMKTRTIAPHIIIAAALVAPLTGAGEITISLPIHLPNLTLDANGHTIEKDVGELANMATAYATFGIKYDADAWFIRYNGWGGTYGNGWSTADPLGGGIKVRDVNASLDFQMKQSIQAAEFGLKLIDSHDFTMHFVSGVRMYSMDIRAWGELSGEINQGGPLRPDWQPIGGRSGSLNGVFQLPAQWNELTMGLQMEYALNDKNSLDAFLSYGHAGSYRAEAAYKYTFSNGWFTRAGYRVDAFEIDGISTKEAGALIEIGVTF